MNKEHQRKYLQAHNEKSKIFKTKEDIDEVIRLYKDEGLSCNEIAKKYGCSKSPVLKALKGVPKRNPGEYGQHFSKTQGVGESHHSWKGGIKSVYDRIRDLKCYWDWRNFIVSRDGNKCVSCESSERLEVHHKKTLKSLVNTYCEINNKYPKELTYEDLSDSYFYDLENGITYCSKCHRDHHKENGR